MLNNPFSPIFGGRPDFFFGRTDILHRFDVAMLDKGSEDRALFITGALGTGKTALLEQLSIRAAKPQRQVIDLGPEDTVSQLVKTLAQGDEVTKTISPQASVSVLGVGGGISAGSVSQTRHYGREDLQRVLLDACAKARHGILVTIDEIQKVPIDDISAICNAFQMASREGHDIMLAVAGLPYAYQQVIRHKGCTFLRRASHEETALFGWQEAAEALGSVFGRVKGLTISQEQIATLNEASYGHPYLMQLLGYFLVTLVNETSDQPAHVVTDSEIEQVVPMAVESYERRALQPIVDELNDGELAYLQAMSERLDEQRMAAAGDVARALGKTTGQLSKTRASLLGKGLVAAPAYGKLVFCIPYLASFVRRVSKLDQSTRRVLERRV